jgi:hypothetical protein
VIYVMMIYLIYVMIYDVWSMCFSSTKIPTCCFFHLTSARRNGTVIKKHFRLAQLLTGCYCPSFSIVGVLNTFM